MIKKKLGSEHSIKTGDKCFRLLCIFFVCCVGLLQPVNSQFSSTFGSSSTPPNSPCPSTFQYQSNGYETYGVGQLLPGQYEVGGDIIMLANLIVGTQLPSNYYGKIRFTGTPEQVVNQMYSNEPIQFEIKFPTQDPLPTIASIVVNGNTICAADQFAGIQQQGYFTRVSLQYMFKPIVSGNFRPRPSLGQRPNNIFTTQKTINQQSQNHNGFQFFEIENPISTPYHPNFVQTQTVPPVYYPKTQPPAIVQPQNPSTEHTINLVNPNNNFGIDLPVSQTKPQTTEAPAVVVENPTRVQTTTTNYDVGCGKIPKPFTPLVYGGTALVKGDWPFIAALHHYAQSSLKFKCGATIISRTTVISAAHCFYNRRQRLGAEDILAFIGHFNLKRLQEDGSRIINLASVIIHPDYQSKSELYSDIAVGKLSETIVFSEFIQPACLWSGSPDQSQIIGRKGAIAGWGLDESGMQTAEPKRVEVPIVSDQKCLRSHEGFGKITSDRTFCAGWRNGSEGPCAGDSGSGLMLNQDGMWYLRGLVSVSLKDANTGTCDLNEFVVYTDVAKFVSWITSLL